MASTTIDVVRFADPYKQCGQCGGWIDGAVLVALGRQILLPCEHRGPYVDVCPSWSPVDGCGCAAYTAQHPDDPISHPVREPANGDRRMF